MDENAVVAGNLEEQVLQLSKTVQEQGALLQQFIQAPIVEVDQFKNPPDNISEGEIENEHNPFGLDFNQPGEADASNDLLEVFQDTETQIEYGPEIMVNVAEGLSKTVSRNLSKESVQTLSAKLKVPLNCKALIAPKMNQEIWAQLPTKAKVQDLGLQHLHQAMSYGLVALAQISNTIATNSACIHPEMAKDLLRTCMDGANLVGQGFQSLIQKRRSEVRPYLNPEFSGICSTATPVTTFLFGDDLKETLKSSKTASQVVKRNFMKPKFSRSKPYDRQQRAFTSNQSFHLNRTRPSPMYQRRGGGWSARARQGQSAWRSQQ